MGRSLVAIFVLLQLPAPADADSKPLNRSGLPLRPEPVEVRLADGSRLHLTVADEEFSFTTSFGKLQIKLADVVKIEFGRRAPIDIARRVEAALASIKVAEKAAAWAELTAAGEWAYPGLLQLAKHGEPSVAAKAVELLAKLRKSVPDERLRRVDRDIVHTETSRLSGRVDLAEFRAITPHFGPLKLKVGDLAMLQLGPSAEPDEAPANVQSDPGYLSNFQQHVGQSFYFRVTGAAGGSVWGTDVYTTDSNLAAVSVHAGVLKMGQAGIVKVTILSGQGAYTGSSRNGIDTSNYNQYPGSYKVSRVGRSKDD